MRVAKEEETSENGGKEGRMMGQTRKGSIGGEGPTKEVGMSLLCRMLVTPLPTGLLPCPHLLPM